MMVGPTDGLGRQAIGRERSEQDWASVWEERSRGSVSGFNSSDVLFSHLGLLPS